MAHLAHHDHHNTDATDIFGFWIYILSDCILFAIIFATYAVLHTSVYGGPALKEFINMPYVLAETMALLISSFTYGLAILALYKSEHKKVMVWLIITFLFGLAFVGMEVNEFIHMYLEGHTWQSSAALSAFFTLVGTHGLHVTLGLIWMLVSMIQLSFFRITPVMQRRLTYLGLFWAFLDIVCILCICSLHFICS